MTCPFSGGPSRRALFSAAGMLAAATALRAPRAEAATAEAIPFHGEHQAGIATAQPSQVAFMAFDVAARDRAALAGMMRGWTDAARRLTAGQAVDGDGGSATGLGPARLTLTFGFGPGLFAPGRFGLETRRPEALAELPRFNGDQLDPAKSGGDLGVQACADDPQVALHAVRELARLAYGAAFPRWLQSGFLPDAPSGETPRNLMGFRDGTRNLAPGTEAFERGVWVGEEGPDWMRGGSYLVARRIRIALEHWDRTDVDFQEQTIGRAKASGAPLGARAEHDTPNFDLADTDGNPVIPERAHLRLGAPETNSGAAMLRRGYGYNDGLAFTAERWPPWRQGMLLDAGLFFLAYQRDPRAAFTKVFERMAKLDMLNQYTTHTGTALFACPPGVQAGRYIGETLLG
jgi:deferrochelatase/peroxidase EfeB